MLKKSLSQYITDLQSRSERLLLHIARPKTNEHYTGHYSVNTDMNFASIFTNITLSALRKVTRHTAIMLNIVIPYAGATNIQDKIGMMPSSIGFG